MIKKQYSEWKENVNDMEPKKVRIQWETEFKKMQELNCKGMPSKKPARVICWR